MDQKLQEMLDKLTPIELEEVSRHIAYRYARSSLGDLTPKDYMYWEALCRAMDNGYSDDHATLTGFLAGQRRTGGYGIKKYRVTCGRIELFIRQGCRGNILSKVQFCKLIFECFSAVVGRMRHLAIPVSPAIVMDHAGSSLEEAVNWQLPGYYRAGMLHMVGKGTQVDA